MEDVHLLSHVSRPAEPEAPPKPAESAGEATLTGVGIGAATGTVAGAATYGGAAVVVSSYGLAATGPIAGGTFAAA